MGVTNTEKDLIMTRLKQAQGAAPTQEQELDQAIKELDTQLSVRMLMNLARSVRSGDVELVARGATSAGPCEAVVSLHVKGSPDAMASYIVH